MSARGERCGYLSLVSGFERKVSNRCRQSSVFMFVYIEIASYVKRHAFGGSVSRSSKRRFNAKESLKYVPI